MEERFCLNRAQFCGFDIYLEFLPEFLMSEPVAAVVPIQFLWKKTLCIAH